MLSEKRTETIFQILSEAGAHVNSASAPLTFARQFEGASAVRFFLRGEPVLLQHVSCRMR